MLASFNAAELALVVQTCRCIRECLPACVRMGAERLGLRLAALTRIRLSTRLLNRFETEIAEMPGLVEALKVHRGRWALDESYLDHIATRSELLHKHPAVLTAHVTSLVGLLPTANDYVQTSVIAACERVDSERLACVWPSIVLIIDRYSSLSQEARKMVKREAADKALKLLHRLPLPALGHCAPLLARCLDREEVPATPTASTVGLDEAGLMKLLSKLPPAEIEPHTGSIVRWLRAAPRPWQGQAAVLSPALVALHKLRPERLVSHLPALEAPVDDLVKQLAKALVNKVRRAARAAAASESGHAGCALGSTS